MINEEKLGAIERRLAALVGKRWERVDWEGEPAILVKSEDGREFFMRVTRDKATAAREDVEFIATARHDTERLIAHMRARLRLDQKEVDAIEARAARASRGPWKAFIGGAGGDSMIRVSEDDSEPDLYLWFCEDLAPDPDFQSSDVAPDPEFEFVATARQDIPDLVAAVRHQAGQQH